LVLHTWPNLGKLFGLVTKTAQALHTIQESIMAAIPFTIEPDAAARVAELGMKAELEQMIKHVCQAVPKLRRIDVVLQPPYDTGNEPSIIIDITREAPPPGDDPTQRELGNWEADNFSPDVGRHFIMLVQDDIAHAG
jgi:hypothetical protein